MFVADLCDAMAETDNGSKRGKSAHQKKRVSIAPAVTQSVSNDSFLEERTMMNACTIILFTIVIPFNTCFSVKL